MNSIRFSSELSFSRISAKGEEFFRGCLKLTIFSGTTVPITVFGGLGVPFHFVEGVIGVPGIDSFQKEPLRNIRYWKKREMFFLHLKENRYLFPIYLDLLWLCVWNPRHNVESLTKNSFLSYDDVKGLLAFVCSAIYYYKDLGNKKTMDKHFPAPFQFEWILFCWFSLFD